jgi:hypothetical protein
MYVANLIRPIVPCCQAKGTRGHEDFQCLVRDLRASFLEFAHVTPNGVDGKFLEFAGEHFSRFVGIVDLL